MKRIYTLLALLATALFAYACASGTGGSSSKAENALTRKEKADGWVLLFDGKSMEHWRGFKKDAVPAAWQIEDGAIALVGKGGGDIVTKEEYQDFELMLDWKISEGGNSGIFFNVSEEPKFRYTFQTGPEMQIIDDERHPDAKQGKNGNRKAGTNYDLHPLSEPAVKPAGEYNTVRLVVKGGNVEQYLNGKKVVEYALWSPEWEHMVQESKFVSMPDYGRYKRGHIALQDHGDKVWFKNIKIRPL
ncbi:3-keto-disaccharide hydrolase [Pontibacter anaerobius]|uniref:DUF1080 domain-containing protein n=1 Tax=Pontibacter anaerobius TaxID=2993940 RepID=A0ABT3RDX6_9BACT|nr:DUF1080 domain-containing protein [Pontibacter anaerobius]MCX2739740.1 DUF1080 domain-containing protein [Pontibacter anaerobius]